MQRQLSSSDSFRSATSHPDNSHPPTPALSSTSFRPQNEIPNESNTHQSHSSPTSPFDWGLDEATETQQVPPRPHPLHITHDPDFRDTLKLRAYDETLEQPTSSNYVIGVFDPAAKTDDWGDDFVLESSSELPSSTSRTAEAPSSFPPWIPEQELTDKSWYPSVTDHHSFSPGHFATSSNHPLLMRPVPSSAFATPTLSHASLLMYPAIGYDAGAAHPSCASVRELFSKNHLTIRTHFDALVRDCGGLVALDDHTRDVYLLSGDSDLLALYAPHVELSTDILLWKLEWANVCGDGVGRAVVLLALANIYKQNGDISEAMYLIRDALDGLPETLTSALGIAVSAELEYESCILHRGTGSIAEAGRALKRAIAHSSSLCRTQEKVGDLKGPQQRGLWWQLRCKFLQAEMAYVLGDHDSAVQYYSEYIIDSITRMIGETPPPSGDQEVVGSEFMRYCLFSPRHLVLALWTSVLSLGEMKSFGAAADIASLTGLVATAFGYDDAHNAASAVRTRIKEIGVELRQQYEEISQSILQNDELTQDEIRGSTSNQGSGAPFDYGTGEFGDIADELVEDWDTQLERELNITIKRCDGDQQNFETASLHALDGTQDLLPSMKDIIPPDHDPTEGTQHRPSVYRYIPDKYQHPGVSPASGWATDSQHGALIEAQLRQYLGRVTGTASAFAAQQIYPKPTQPFHEHELGPREHENFLRRFVRSKDPAQSRRIRRGLPMAPQWHPSAICKLNFNIEPIEDIEAFNSGTHVLSAAWALKLLDAVWKIVRSQVNLVTKQIRLRRLILTSLSRISSIVHKKPLHAGSERGDRLEMFAALLDVLRLAREVITSSGGEAVWFSRACKFLGIISATVTPAAKAAVELFQAESRAHCGIKAVVPAPILEECAIAAQKRAEQDADLVGSSTSVKQSIGEGEAIPSELNHSVVDLLHALYWRSKAGFDESSNKNSVERLLHAEVASGLFLTGCGASPVDGSPIRVEDEIAILHLPRKKMPESEGPNELVDETRRVNATELVQELQSLWLTLPSSGVVRAKVSFALAHHCRVNQKDYARAERFLFDGMRSLHATSPNETLPNSFFTKVLHISPVSVVSSCLAGALLRSYGYLTLSHSKYRYSIAAREAESDARRVRNMDRHEYRSSVMEVVDTAITNNDWRRALILLHNLRHLMHPKSGLRNEFLQLCLRLHAVCADAGCFAASVVPLRAYSSLIYEERLRILLQRYKRRLAKKSRSLFRRFLPGSPLPKLLPGTKTPKNSLASFFETPPATPVVEMTPRQPTSTSEDGNRHACGAFSTATKPLSSHDTASYIHSLLWPLPVASIRRQSERIIGPTRDSLKSFVEANGVKVPQSRSSQAEFVEGRDEATPLSMREIRPDPEFQEEQRELLRIEAEQERTADSDRYVVELLRAQTEFAMADFDAADSRCRSLLEISTPNASRYKVWELMARIRLKRKEITKCLEFIERMEHEYNLAQTSRGNTEQARGSGDVQRLSLFRIHDYEKDMTSGEASNMFPPHVTFLRLKALTHGGRLEEALHLADRALEACGEHSFWDQGRLHYLRGKVLFIMSSASTPSFQREDEAKTTSPSDASNLTLRLTELTLAAFETASQYYDAAGDEICAAKCDLFWARTCIDFLFRRVVLDSCSGGGWTLESACSLLDQNINVDDVLDTVHHVVNIACTANIPILLIDSMAALAEVKCVQGQPSSVWSYWVSEAWKLFSRLFTDAEDFTVVLTSLAPVSTLDRLRNICGRLVRLVMCDTQDVSFLDMNKHLRLFEAYVTLHLSIDQKMNLASSAHGQIDSTSENPNHVDEQEEQTQDNISGNSQPTSPSSVRTSKKRSAFANARLNLSRKTADKRGTSGANDLASERASHSASDTSLPRHPPGAFLHMLGNEGVALGRQGFSLFINRPRQQVISAVRGTGAVLIPTNFFSNSKKAPGDGPHELGRDAEMIFPFKPSLGVGAMQILNDDKVVDVNSSMFASGNRSIAGRRAPMPAEVQSPPGEGSAQAGKAPSVPRKGGVSKRMSRANTDRRSDGEYQPKQRNLSKSNSSRGSNQADRTSYPLATNGLFEGKAIRTTDSSSSRNDLRRLLEAVTEEAEGVGVRTKGSSPIFGASTSQRVWAHYHRIKKETKRYMHGGITMKQLQERNHEALLSWIQCLPRSGKEWTVPESIGRRLVYILYAHGVIGYYGVERGGSIARVAFGGKKDSINAEDGLFAAVSSRSTEKVQPLRWPTESERMYLFELVKGFKRDSVWYKNRDSEIVNGMANQVLRAPRLFLSSSSPVQKSRSRPIVLIADLAIQILPWELFFDHVVIRSHCLLDIIRGLQGESTQNSSSLLGSEDPAIAANRPVVRFISFGPRRKVVDLERTEETRRQQLGFQGLLRLNHMDPSSLTTFLDMGGFSDPTATSAVVRPTGPLSSPLSQSRKAVKLFGLRISANIGKRNYPHMDFLKVAGLGSATTWDLKEAAMMIPVGASDKDYPKRDLGAYIPVFMFSYADLVDSSDSVFGLRRLVPNGILLFTPAIHMKVLARHLEDDELSVELGQASGRVTNRIFPDVTASARALLEYVSRFSREKRIPIVVFLGQGLLDVFPYKKAIKKKDDRLAPQASLVK